MHILSIIIQIMNEMASKVHVYQASPCEDEVSPESSRYLGCYCILSCRYVPRVIKVPTCVHVSAVAQSPHAVLGALATAPGRCLLITEVIVSPGPGGP